MKKARGRPKIQAVEGQGCKLGARGDQQSGEEPAVEDAGPEGGVDEGLSRKQIEAESSDVTGLMPSAGDGVEDMGEGLTKDEEETGEPQTDAAFRVATTKKEKENKQDAKGCGVRNEMEIHGRPWR